MHHAHSDFPTPAHQGGDRQGAGRPAPAPSAAAARAALAGRRRTDGRRATDLTPLHEQAHAPSALWPDYARPTACLPMGCPADAQRRGPRLAMPCHRLGLVDPVPPDGAMRTMCTWTSPPACSDRRIACAASTPCGRTLPKTASRALPDQRATALAGARADVSRAGHRLAGPGGCGTGLTTGCPGSRRPAACAACRTRCKCCSTPTR